MAAGRPEFSVHVRIEDEFQALVSAQLLAQAAREAVRDEELRGRSSMVLTITCDRTVRELNHAYRGMDATTDVLSFSYLDQAGPTPEEADEFPMPPCEEAGIGDVVVSFPQASRQAEEARVPLAEEIVHLVTHGTLHLLGYDHDDSARDQAMRAKESAVLGRLFNKTGPETEE